MKTVALAVFVAALLAFQPLSFSYGQQLAYESPAGTKFLLYTPPSYSTGSQPHPLLISLHSKGEVADDLTQLTSNNPEQMPSRLIYINRWPAELPFIVLTPQLKPTEADPDPQWPAEYIDEVVRYVTANYRVDMNRIYLTGISRGGTGAWTYASAFPGKIAAMVPLAGRTDPATQACLVKDIPTWVFHGDADPTVPASASIDIVKAIYNCQPPGKFNPRLNILNARAHNGWNEVYNGTNGYRIFEWLLKFTKNSDLNTAPYVNAGVDRKMLLRSGPLRIRGDFFDSDGTIAGVEWKQISGTPLTLDNINSEFLTITALQAGTFELELTATDNDGTQSSDRVVLTIAGAISGPAVTGLVLMNGATNTDIGNITEGMVINKSTLNLAEINIRALATSDALSVRFSVNSDQNTRTLNSTSPLLIKAPSTGPEWIIESGEYLICATPYSKGSASGTQGISQCYKITVTDGESRCDGTGEIRREEWVGITGANVSSIPVNTMPASTSVLTLFEGPTNIADNYGARIRGYVCPPFSGNYTFWIASNDKSELWLSTDSDPAHKVMIASVTGYTNSRQWTKSITQQSSPINLVAGNTYYIEALHKEGTGSDNLAVGWQLPNGTLERPIPGKRLIPYQAPANYAPVVNITSPTEGQTFSAPASVIIFASATDNDGSIAKVEFYKGSTLIGEDALSPYSINCDDLPVGNHQLSAKAFDNTGASSTASVNIVVSDGQTCTASGTILREMWTGITGATVSLIPVSSPPSSTSQLTIFEGPTNIGTNYGARIRGYLCAPTTGNYIFWISSNDYSEVWLSTDDNPANRIRIASVAGYTSVRQWTKYPTQQSQPIPLIAGERYYVEVLHKQATGSDNLAVGWQLPNGVLERPIPGNRLSPFVGAQALVSAYSLTQEAEIKGDVSIYPNPIHSNKFTIRLAGIENISAQSNSFVEITGVTGHKAFSKAINCRECGEIEVQLDQNLAAGIYMIQGQVNGRKFMKRIVVL